MEQIAVVRGDHMYRFLRGTDAPMLADLQRDAGMGPLEYMQWNDMRQRGDGTSASALALQGTSPSTSTTYSRTDCVACLDVSNSGAAAHFRAVQPAMPAVFPIRKPNAPAQHDAPFS